MSTTYQRANGASGLGWQDKLKQSKAKKMDDDPFAMSQSQEDDWGSAKKSRPSSNSRQIPPKSAPCLEALPLAKHRPAARHEAVKLAPGAAKERGQDVHGRAEPGRRLSHTGVAVNALTLSKSSRDVGKTSIFDESLDREDFGTAAELERESHGSRPQNANFRPPATIYHNRMQKEGLPNECSGRESVGITSTNGGRGLNDQIDISHNSGDEQPKPSHASLPAQRSTIPRPEENESESSDDTEFRLEARRRRRGTAGNGTTQRNTTQHKAAVPPPKLAARDLCTARTGNTGKQGSHSKEDCAPARTKPRRTVQTSSSEGDEEEEYNPRKDSHAKGKGRGRSNDWEYSESDDTIDEEESPRPRGGKTPNQRKGKTAPLNLTRRESRGMALSWSQAGGGNNSNRPGLPQPQSIKAKEVMQPQPLLMLFEQLSAMGKKSKVFVLDKKVGPLKPPLLRSDSADANIQVVQVEGLLEPDKSACTNGAAIALGDLIRECEYAGNVLRYRLKELCNFMSSAGYKYWNPRQSTIEEIYLPSLITVILKDDTLIYRIRGHSHEDSCIYYSRVGELPEDDLTTDEILLRAINSAASEEQETKERKRRKKKEDKQEDASQEATQDTEKGKRKRKSNDDKEKDKSKKPRGTVKAKNKNESEDVEEDEDGFRVYKDDAIVQQLLKRGQQDRRVLPPMESFDVMEDDSDSGWNECSRS